MFKKLLPVLLLFILSALMLSACKDKHEHNYVETVFPSTCKEMGYTQRLCTDCGDELLYDYKARTGHSGEWQIAKEPTCQAVGTEEKICLTCNIVFETRSVAKLGHISGEWKVTKAPTCKDTGTEKLFCSTCGIDLETKTLEVISDHDFTTNITPPSLDSDGFTTYICKICEFSKKDDYVSINSDLSANDIYNKISNSMVRIDAYDKNGKRISLGSGFFISNDGKIATNYHVVDSAYNLKAVLYSDDSTHTVTNILGYNKSQDVAVIQINLNNTPYLKISNDSVNVGDIVYTLGSPKGVDDIFTSGMVSNSSVTVSGKECIAFTAPISSGNSGGPLVNKNGEVIGINTMKVTDAENFNLAILSKQITSLNLNTPVSPSTHYNNNLSANAFGIFACYIMVNADGTKDDQYIKYTSVKETENNVGFEYYSVYDVEKGELIFRTYIVKNAKRLYMYEFEITKISDNYTIRFYDIKEGQYTIEAIASTKMPAVSYKSDFESLFNIYTFRYIEGDTVPPENMKQIFFLSYQATMNHFKELLANSNTGLAMSHFNINF